MRILTRLSDLVSVNVHALLDRAEDPEQMLAQLLRTMEHDLLEARRRTAQALAAERRMARELSQQRSQRDECQQQAQAALSLGREDLARRILGRRLDLDGMIQQLETYHQATLHLCQQAKAALAELQQRLTEARARQAFLIARQRTAEVRAQIEPLLTMHCRDVSTPFDLLERRLAEREDMLLATAELSRDGDELADLERTRRIEGALLGMRETSSSRAR